MDTLVYFSNFCIKIGINWYTKTTFGWWLQTNPKEREYITPVKFKMNENYHEPIGISEEYKKANELQRRRLETAKYLPEQQTANVDMNYNFA